MLMKHVKTDRKIPVAEHLNDLEYKIFAETYAKHNASMGLSERPNYDLSKITKVESNSEENCLNVHYSNGDWWHYTPKRTWY